MFNRGETRDEAITHSHDEESKPAEELDVSMHLEQLRKSATKTCSLRCRMRQKQTKRESDTESEEKGRTDKRRILVFLAKEVS
jgi:hypothetical protein